MTEISGDYWPEPLVIDPTSVDWEGLARSYVVSLAHTAGAVVYVTYDGSEYEAATEEDLIALVATAMRTPRPDEAE